jgi:hypothetical protein
MRMNHAAVRHIGGTAMRSGPMIAVLLGLAAAAAPVRADVVQIGGIVTQSTPDRTGPAFNNPSLNNINDLQAYTLILTFSTPITAPGNYNLTGSSLLFSVASAPASESSFGSINLSIALNAGFDEFSLLACLTTGSSCPASNQLTANFKIPAAMINSQNVTATGLDQPHPLDLLEDEGTTDIQGSITTYSKSGSVSAVPEPSTLFLLGSALALIAAGKRMYSPNCRVGRL